LEREVRIEKVEYTPEKLKEIKERGIEK